MQEDIAHLQILPSAFVLFRIEPLRKWPSENAEGTYFHDYPSTIQAYLNLIRLYNLGPNLTPRTDCLTLPCRPGSHLALS